MRMNLISTVRKQLDVTQAELADAIGVTQGNIGHYEKGQLITPRVAARLIYFAQSRGLELSFNDIYSPFLVKPSRKRKAP